MSYYTCTSYTTFEPWTDMLTRLVWWVLAFLPLPDTQIPCLLQIFRLNKKKPSAIVKADKLIEKKCSSLVLTLSIFLSYFFLFFVSSVAMPRQLSDDPGKLLRSLHGLEVWPDECSAPLQRGWGWEVGSPRQRPPSTYLASCYAWSVQRKHELLLLLYAVSDLK